MMIGGVGKTWEIAARNGRLNFFVYVLVHKCDKGLLEKLKHIILATLCTACEH